MANRFEPTAGICASCNRARRIVSGRGSTFWLCGRAEEDPDYRRYPQLPIRSCAGWEAIKTPDDSASQG